MNNTQTKKGRKPKEKRYDSKFAEVLRALLAKKEESGITLSAVADDLGITRQSLAQYRDGNNIPDIVILGRMADYFDVTTDYLLGRTGVQSSDLDAQKFFEMTGLSETVFENLCSPKSILETETLNAFFEDNYIELIDLSFGIFEKYEIQAFRQAVFIKFVKDKNLPITNDMIDERGEYSLKNSLKGDEYFKTASEFEDYYRRWAQKIGIKEDQEEYQDYCLQKVANHFVSNTLFFFYSSKTAKYLNNYYSKLLALEEAGASEKVLELYHDKMLYLDSITKNGRYDNGKHNRAQE